jgi:hypothetical protein
MLFRTPEDYIAITLFREYMMLPPDLRSNTVVIGTRSSVFFALSISLLIIVMMITVTVSKDAPWLYCNSLDRPKALDDLITIG